MNVPADARTAAATTAEFFHDYAQDFDAIYGTKHTWIRKLVNKYLRASMRLRFEKTLAGCNPIEGKSVIDIGCGPGHYTVALGQRGAARLYGLDFAEGMVDIARRRAEQAGIGDRCEFAIGDFMKVDLPEQFDYAIVMGFMDYVAAPQAMIDRTLGITRNKAFFSFPAQGGFLAWQRQLRYKSRCDLYLYSEPAIRTLFDASPAKSTTIEKINRDFFVTASMEA